MSNICNIHYQHMDLTHKSCWFLVCFLSSWALQSLYRMLDFAPILMTAFKQGLTHWYSTSYLSPLLVQFPYCLNHSNCFNFILNFKTSAMTLFILSLFDIFSNLVKMFSLISTKFTLHFTSGSLISCFWFCEPFGSFKKAGPSNRYLILPHGLPQKPWISLIHY